MIQLIRLIRIKQLGLIPLCLLFSISVSGCSMETSQPVVSFSTTPASVQTGQPVKLIGTVKAGEKPVNDAEMKMEIWRDGESRHEMFDTVPVPDQQGHYALTRTFNKAGTYYVMLHTNANHMHIMPTATFTVKEAK